MAPADNCPGGISMNNIITDYQKWKQQGEDLRVQAKQAMEARFKELLTQAIDIAEEYRADFGGPLKPPPVVTAFRYKAAGKSRPKKNAKAGVPAAKGVAAPAKVAVKANPKTAGLEKRLAAAELKLQQAKASGAPTKNLEDRVYEIEDAIRLSAQAG
jgi:ubiquitin